MTWHVIGCLRALFWSLYNAAHLNILKNVDFFSQTALKSFPFTLMSRQPLERTSMAGRTVSLYFVLFKNDTWSQYRGKNYQVLIGQDRDNFSLTRYLSQNYLTVYRLSATFFFFHSTIAIMKPSKRCRPARTKSRHVKWLTNSAFKTWNEREATLRIRKENECIYENWISFHAKVS